MTTMDEFGGRACVARNHQYHYHRGRIVVTPAPQNYGVGRYMERIRRADNADPAVKAAVAWLKSGGQGTYRQSNRVLS